MQPVTQPNGLPPRLRPVTDVKGIGERRAALLAKLGIETVRDLIYHFPRSHQDRTRTTPISELRVGEMATVMVEVVSTEIRHLRRRLSLAFVRVKDETGTANATWFNQPFMKRVMAPGEKVVLTGEIGKYSGVQIKNPDYEVLSGTETDRIHTGRIVPMYPLTEGISQRRMRSMVWAALDQFGNKLEESLPRTIRRQLRLPAARTAIHHVHFPPSFGAQDKARRRFVFEELLKLQLSLLLQRKRVGAQRKAIEHRLDGRLLEQLRKSLPFSLTKAQRRAIDRLLTDMSGPSPMQRLLQGDVGCGKTVVALHGVATALDSDYQVAFMAPTEVLAEQHFLNIKRWLSPLGLKVHLLTGGIERARAEQIRHMISNGDAKFVVGTHALIQESVRFKRLGLVVIDEQQRFGVPQRNRLLGKGDVADLLVMTATPIPRTVAMILYGGLDITVIDEMPPGRIPVVTRHAAPDEITNVYEFIRGKVNEGRQCFFVCPVIEDSPKSELKALSSTFKRLSGTEFGQTRTALLHGRMSSEEKETTMSAFARGEIDILFATTVIEVGIDVPNAAIMVIEDAGRYGLAQLHQLRGRVGRGDEQSWCFLCGTPRTREGRRRIEVMQETSDGFVIAEEDLKLRGPGEVLGLRQSGPADLKIVDLVRDTKLIETARAQATLLLREHPDLEGDELRALREAALKGSTNIKTA